MADHIPRIPLDIAWNGPRAKKHSGVLVAVSVADLDALAAQVADLDDALTQTIEERDNAIEWADRLAYAIAPESVIGEHSSLNNPWQNAIDAADGNASSEEVPGG